MSLDKRNNKRYKSTYRKNKMHPVIAVALVALLVIMYITAFYKINKPMDLDDYCIEKYTVEKGDTLWSICYEYTDEHTDTRVWVNEVKKLNNIDNLSFLYPGDTIYIYASKTD